MEQIIVMLRCFVSESTVIKKNFSPDRIELLSKAVLHSVSSVHGMKIVRQKFRLEEKKNLSDNSFR
jgi:hypothetical protein